MREDGGFEVIKKAILNLSLRHEVHISAYGEGNERRLTGKHETASIDTFSWVCPEAFALMKISFPLETYIYNLQGVANRGCSIRVGRDTEKNGKGLSLEQGLFLFFCFCHFKPTDSVTLNCF